MNEASKKEVSTKEKVWTIVKKTAIPATCAVIAIGGFVILTKLNKTNLNVQIAELVGNADDPWLCILNDNARDKIRQLMATGDDIKEIVESLDKTRFGIVEGPFAL